MSSHIDTGKLDKATLDAWLDDPSNYKWKYFYYNPKDKRVLPLARRRSVRIGFSGKPVTGWTINFANPYSILAFIGITVGFIGIVQLLIWALTRDV